MEVLLVLLGIVLFLALLWAAIVAAYFVWLLLPGIAGVVIAVAFLLGGHDNLAVLSFLAGVIWETAWINGVGRDRVEEMFKKK